MKTNHFTFIFAALLFALGCTFSCSKGSKQPIEKQTVAIDTTITLRTDSVNPEWNANIDSMLRLATTAKQDTNMANMYYSIAKMYEDNDTEKAKEYYLKCNDLSKRLDWDAGRWMFADAFSVLLMREGLMDSALVVLAPALESAKKQNNEKWIAVLTTETGQVYLMKDWYETALSYYMEALPIFERMNDNQRLGALYQKFGRIYQQLYLDDKAIEYGEKSVALLGDNPYALFELGNAYSTTQQYEKSNDYYKKALQICMQQNNKYLMEITYFMLANNALTVFDMDRVEMYLNKMLETGGGEENMSFHYQYLVMRGSFERLKGNFAQSEKYMLQALEIATEQDLLEEKRLGYLVMAELSLAQHKYRENTQYLEKMIRVEKDIARGTATRATA